MFSPLFMQLGCAEWPRVDHLSADSEGGVPAGSAPVLVWTKASEPPDLAGDSRNASASPLAPFEGVALRGTVDGFGFDVQIDAQRPDDCGEISAFPYASHGSYTGDVDWRAFILDEPGVLCSTFRFGAPGAFADVLIYALDACSVPVAALSGDDGRPLGYDVRASSVRWMVNLPAGRYGVVAAGWQAYEPSEPSAYDWDIYLYPAGAGPLDAGLCPTATSEVD